MDSAPPIYYPSTTQRFGLTLPFLVDRCSTFHGDTEIVTRIANGWHKTNFRSHAVAARKLASALEKFGVRPGDRIGSYMNNSARHLNLYHAIPCMGCVMHTMNIKIQPSHLGYTINNAVDRVVFIDEDLVDAFLLCDPKDLAPIQLMVVSGTDMGRTKHSSLAKIKAKMNVKVADFDDFLSTGSADFQWPPINEWTGMGICYTSGTTGMPKGVVYSHRSTVLHSLVTPQTDVFQFSAKDTILLCVPMYHVMGWCIPYSALTTGCRLVFLGRHFTPENVVMACEQLGVTTTQGVPTVMQSIREVLETKEGKLKLALDRVLCGGSKPSAELMDYFYRKWNVEFMQAWGMTETNPIGTVARRVGKNKHLGWSDDRCGKHPQMAGMPVPGVEMKIVDPEDLSKELPWDGKSQGELLIRGPWITGGYLGLGSAGKMLNGYLRTGDVAVIDSEGYMDIKDRSKDLIKSGGEWISSVDLENAVISNFSNHLTIAAIVAAKHPKWQERPVLVVQLKPGSTQSDVSLAKVKTALTAADFTKFQLPDDVVYWDAVPLTSTGKIDKKNIRKRLDAEGYKLRSLRAKM